MKTKLITMLAVVGIVGGLSFEANAQFTADYWINLAKSSQDSFCAPSGISIRRLDGVACNVKLLAALAVYICYDNAAHKEGFRKGKCYGKAEGHEDLGKGVDTAKAKAVLFKEAQSIGGTVFNLVKGLVGMGGQTEK